MTATRASLMLLLLLISCSGAKAPEASSASTAATPDPARPLPLPLPDVVARVNGREIGIRQILPLAKALLDSVSVSERDKRKPEAVRQALEQYVSRELLLQEAIARGISADTREVERSYDQLRREHVADADWNQFLSEQGMDPQSFKAELRAQHTISALVSQEVQRWRVPESEARAAFEADPQAFAPPGADQVLSFEAVRSEVEQAVRRRKTDEIQAALVERLRARAKVELYL
jgi:SurA-like N-terminal domain